MKKKSIIILGLVTLIGAATIGSLSNGISSESGSLTDSVFNNTGHSHIHNYNNNVLNNNIY